MAEFVKGETLKSSEKEDFDKNLISLPKSKKYLVITDDDGNVKGYFPLKEKKLGKDWIALYQQAISTIADMNLPNEQYRVFLKLLSKVDFENYLTVSQQNIADELSMKRPNVTKAIKALCEKNIVIEGPRAGLNKTYRLNPYIAHKGKNRKETILDFEAELVRQGKNITDADITKK
ncbi:MAG: replication/maintenance protein RepL [Selenomonadaceae bacterium]|nr:replication/maintenance protein RepL [Selenomonadaceae bacterium]